MTSGNTSSAHNIALFIDMENLIRSAIDIALPVDLTPIVAKVLEYGRISVRRGFGDLDIACRGDWKLRSQIRRMIHDNLVQLEDIPYVTRYKNTADMRLAVEALALAYTYPDISCFAIVAADRDYVPLISKLRELGRHIIGIGTSPDTVNEIYVKSCDNFLYYSSLFPVATQSHLLASQADGTRIGEYLELLCKAITALIQRGSKSVGAAIAPLMRQLKPDFDPKLAGLNSFRDLVAVAEDRKLVKISPSGGDILITPTEGMAALLENAGKPEIFDPKDLSKTKLMYLDFIQEKLKC